MSLKEEDQGGDPFLPEKHTVKKKAVRNLPKCMLTSPKGPGTDETKPKCFDQSYQQGFLFIYFHPGRIPTNASASVFQWVNSASARAVGLSSEILIQD